MVCKAMEYFRDFRDYLGIETQRKCSDLAITRTSPLLFCMYSLVTIIGNNHLKTEEILPHKTAWYDKQHLTFSDLYQAVKVEQCRHKSDFREKAESEILLRTNRSLWDFIHYGVLNVQSGDKLTPTPGIS